MKQNVAKTTRREYGTLLAAMAWIVIYFIARAGLGANEWTVEVRIALALLPVLPFAFFLWSFVNGVRSMDELERRIHLEALVIAFPLMTLLLMTLGLLELAIELNPADWSYRYIWVFAPLFYFIGLAVARRRYL
jgi:hypothetical protein